MIYLFNVHKCPTNVRKCLLYYVDLVQYRAITDITDINVCFPPFQSITVNVCPACGMSLYINIIYILLIDNSRTFNGHLRTFTDMPIIYNENYFNNNHFEINKIEGNKQKSN